LRVDLRRKKPIEKFSKLSCVLRLLPNLTSAMTALLALALAVTW
jgi:hypothetical protein